MLARTASRIMCCDDEIHDDGAADQATGFPWIQHLQVNYTRWIQSSTEGSRARLLSTDGNGVNEQVNIKPYNIHLLITPLPLLDTNPARKPLSGP